MKNRNALQRIEIANLVAREEMTADSGLDARLLTTDVLATEGNTAPLPSLQFTVESRMSGTNN